MGLVGLVLLKFRNPGQARPDVGSSFLRFFVLSRAECESGDAEARVGVKREEGLVVEKYVRRLRECLTDSA
jgi:hypothetical protein